MNFILYVTCHSSPLLHLPLSNVNLFKSIWYFFLHMIMTGKKYTLLHGGANGASLIRELNVQIGFSSSQIFLLEALVF